MAEISSFQLETVHSFNPDVSAILNITPDHLNRHGTMEIYTDCKLRIAKNQDVDEPVILNYEDEILRDRAKELTNKIVWFSSKQKVPCGVYLDGEDIVYFDQNHIDVLVASPGVPLEADFMVKADEAGIPIWSEVELAYVAGRGKVIGITGTNGKTTTTSLVGEIMKSHFDDVKVV